MMFFRVGASSLPLGVLGGMLLLWLLSGQAWSASPSAVAQALQQAPQALNMSGYVLNAETDPNQLRLRQIQYGISPWLRSPQEENLIEIRGPVIPPLPPQQSPLLLNTPIPGQ